MAALEPYAPCPCGSGEKYKWCCHKVEAVADRARRFAENGQIEPALGALDEGLKKTPNNPWLALLKAIYQARRGEVLQAEEFLATVARARPDHVGILSFLIRLTAQAKGLSAAAGRLQEALAALKPEGRGALAETAESLGALMVETGYVPGGIAHLELAEALGEGDPDDRSGSTLGIVESNPEFSPWLRNPYELAPTPEGLDPARSRRFEDALELADHALWARAAAAFDALSKDSTPDADYNLGLCRLFLGDHPGAVEALRRHTGWVGALPEIVDLEALCQILSPPPPSDEVELVQWIWPIRGRDVLLAAVEADDRTSADGKTPLDPDEPDSPKVDSFLLIDRPKTPKGTPPDPPRVEGRLLIGAQYAVLEGYDDGRLDRLADRFRALAGDSITPSHPRTKVLGTSSRHTLAMRVEWLMPPDLPPSESKRLLREELRRIIGEVWPDTPHPSLNNRTPRQAAAAGDAKLALRASLCQLELGNDLDAHGPVAEYHAIRRELGVEPEPEIDPSKQEIDEVHLARLHRVPADQLDDGRLVEYFRRARRYMIARAIERAETVLVDRPHLLDAEGGPARFTVFGDLAHFALARDGIEGALEWVRKGRDGQEPSRRAAEAPRWEMLEVRLRARVEGPEKWVPDLAAVLDRHQGTEAGQYFLTAMVEMGLMRLVPNPDAPEEMLLDSRPFQALMARHGPKITTSGGQLGVSASKGGVWTPDQEAGAPKGGGIWTPGQPSTPSGGPKLIVPGR